MRRNNLNTTKTPNKLKTVPIKWAAFIVVAVLGLFLFFGLVKQFVLHSDYFRVQDIITSEGRSIDLNYLKGQNILSIDLDREASYISEFYPGYRKILLYRLFPNRIYVHFIKRVPIAYVKLYRYFYVDSDMVLFNIPTQGEMPDLPVIFGLETKIFGPKSGKKYPSKELSGALAIIKEAGLGRTLKAYPIKRIEVSKLENLSFFVAMPVLNAKGNIAVVQPVYQLLEIKIGSENIKDKMSMLNTLLAQIKNEWNNIAYVDLRFKEPVIKLKMNK